MVENIKAKSISEYIDAIFKYSVLTEHEQKSDPDRTKTFLYRGQSSENYDLIPSLGRPCKPNQPNILWHRERLFVERIKTILPDAFNIEDALNLLAKMQHFGLPTRLLDVSANPLVALYFACENTEENGEVFVFLANNVCSPYEPVIQAIASNYLIFEGSRITFDEYAEQAYNELNLKEDKPVFTSRFKAMIANPLFVSASEHSLRQKAQQGKYILFTNNKGTAHFDNYITAIDKNSPFIKTKITIPKEEKKHLLDQLKILGISKSTLFSDSIDCICAELKEEISATLIVE